MTKFKSSILLWAILLSCANEAKAQELNPNKVIFPSYSAEHRKNLVFPDIDTFKVVTCDFHTHTVFSDGLVWPTHRIDEAWKGGLDALSITDHIEYRPYRKYTVNNNNTSYELALPAAQKMGIMLIRGTEITRKQSSIGHYNAIFIKDADALDMEDPEKAIEAAHNQGAFIIWNHPGWAVDSTVIKPFQQNLLDKNLIKGIEIFNNNEFYPRALSWAIDYGLTIIAASDVHGNVEQGALINHGIERPMTLVLAKEKTPEGIQEALISKRTVAFFNKMIAATETIAKLFTTQTIEIKETIRDQKNSSLLITNKCSVPYDFSIHKKNFNLPANSSILITLPIQETVGNKINLKFNNIFIYENKTLAHDLYFN